MMLSPLVIKLRTFFCHSNKSITDFKSITYTNLTWHENMNHQLKNNNNSKKYIIQNCRISSFFIKVLKNVSKQTLCDKR